MELRDLRSFIEVARQRSFTGAARTLGYTQSAVSQQVATLEGELGHPLLERRPVRPTPAGALLLEHAAHLLRRHDAAAADVRALTTAGPRLAVARTPLVDPDRVARALPAPTEGPSTCSVTTTDTDGVMVGLVQATVDVGLVAGLVRPGTPLQLAEAGLLAVTPVVEEPLAVVVPTDHPLRGPTPLEALSDARWVAAPGLLGDPSGLPPSLRSGGAAPNGIAPPQGPVHRGRDADGLLALVAAGHGIALLPARTVTHPDGGPVTHPGVRGLPLSAPRLVCRVEALVLRATLDRHQPFLARLRAQPGG